jgi:hypothetical protein
MLPAGLPNSFTGVIHQVTHPADTPPLSSKGRVSLVIPPDSVERVLVEVKDGAEPFDSDLPR